MAHWGDDHDKTLRSLWLDSGKSAAQIGDAMGRSRNAIIGRVYRLRLPSRDSKEHKSRGAREAKARREKARKPRPWTGEKVPPPFKPTRYKPPPEQIMVKPKNRRGLMDLRDNQCRWPIGEPGTPEFHFCDQTKVHGVSYCDYHIKIAHETPNQSDAEFPIVADAVKVLEAAE